MFAVLFAGGACRSSDPPPAPAALERRAEPAPVAADRGFELISPGTEPRAPLRYQLVAGAKSRTTLRIAANPISDGTAGASGARPMPAVALTTETEVLPASPDGDFPVRIRVVEAKLEGAPSSVADAALERWRGAELHATATATGRLTGIELRAAGEATAATDPQLQSLATTMQQLAMELPEPALGAGASWAVERPFPQGGLTLKARTVYQLVERDETSARLRSQIFLSAPDQTIERDGERAELSGFTGSGESDVVIDLQKLTARGTTSSSYRGTMVAAGTTAALGMELSVTLTQN